MTQLIFQSNPISTLSDIVVPETLSKGERDELTKKFKSMLNKLQRQAENHVEFSEVESTIISKSDIKERMEFESKMLFKCDNCNYEESIPHSFLEKDEAMELPTHCDKQMYILIPDKL